MNEEQIRSDMTVELVKHSASDLDVVRAARVSTAGERSKMVDGQEALGLIEFLLRERHGSPFEHSYFTFYVEAPIFVWREHMRHRMASYNEESGRYKQIEPVFYVPAVDRPLVQVGKAGAYTFESGTRNQFLQAFATIEESSFGAYDEYVSLLNAGVAREVARMVLPVNIYSSAYVTMNARALMNFLSLRTKSEGSIVRSYPQREIEMVAEQYEAIFKDVMPLTHRAFDKYGRVAP